MTNLDDAASTDVVDAAAVKKKAHTAKKNFHNNKYESESVCVCGVSNEMGGGASDVIKEYIEEGARASSLRQSNKPAQRYKYKII